jgi:pimeloyl-ACP methyl ester carboxylesterase
MTSIQRITDFLPIKSGQLHYEAAGNGSTVVFLHGFSLDRRMWDRQFERFAQRHQVIRYDLRGYGQSTVPTQPYRHVDDLAALLAHLQVSSAALVGLSRGGGVALDFALTYPAQVEKLVLVDTVLGGYRWSDEQRRLDQAVWEQARTQGVAVGKAAWLRHPLFAPALQQPAVAQQLEQMVNDYSGWHFLHRDPEQRLEPPAAQRLHEIHQPALVVVGGRDLPDFQQIAAQVATALPQARKIVLPGVGHLASMEAAEAFTGVVLAFLETNQ